MTPIFLCTEDYSLFFVLQTQAGIPARKRMLKLGRGWRVGAESCCKGECSVSKVVQFVLKEFILDSVDPNIPSPMSHCYAGYLNVWGSKKLQEFLFCKVISFPDPFQSDVSQVEIEDGNRLG